MGVQSAVVAAATAVATAAVAAKVAWSLHVDRTRARSVKTGAPMPGPPPSFLLGNVPELRREGKGHLSQIAERWRQMYGPIVQVYLAGIPAVLVLEAELARQVMNLFERPRVLIVDYIYNQKGVAFSSGQFQRVHRKAVVQMMNEALYRSVAEKAVYSTERLLFPAFDRACEAGGVFDGRAAIVQITLTLSDYVKAPFAFWRFYKPPADVRGDIRDIISAGPGDVRCRPTGTFGSDRHETTMSALTFCMALVARYPETQDLIVGELDAQLAGRPPSFDDLKGLVVLEAAMKETLRLYPPTHQLAREAPPGGVTLGEYFIPGGRWVFLAPWQLHRMEEVFPEPERFDPRRWLGEDERRDRAWAAFGCASII
eukprot:tig00000396_g24897.t1